MIRNDIKVEYAKEREATMNDYVSALITLERTESGRILETVEDGRIKK